jgi:hypothetical protein
MSPGRRFVVLAAAAAVVWYVCILIFWAVQPLTDAVPVGVDYTLKPPRQSSVTVDCNTLFAGSARDNSPLPALAVQPKTIPPLAPVAPLAYAHEPCIKVHHQARILFVLDTALTVAGLPCCVWLALRVGRSSGTERPALARAS